MLEVEFFLWDSELQKIQHLLAFRGTHTHVTEKHTGTYIISLLTYMPNK